MTEQSILEILQREIRLSTKDSGESCGQCGQLVDYVWRVREGDLERCAKLISDLAKPG
jgi:hypothetical protein